MHLVKRATNPGGAGVGLFGVAEAFFLDLLCTRHHETLTNFHFSIVTAAIRCFNPCCAQTHKSTLGKKH